MSKSTHLKSPAHSDEIKISLPEKHLLVLTLNRPKYMNAMTPTLHSDINNLLNWFDDEPSLWVVIVTGEGRAFCAGADLKAWSRAQQSGDENDQERVAANPHGFGAISRRHTSSKPIIAAVNGSTYGGGTEMVLNCDIVIASEEATFQLPEVKRGVIAIQGVIPRLAKVAGHQLASEMLLLGNPISAYDARDRFRFVNLVVPKSEALPRAIEVARTITQNSPDSVQSSKKGLVLSQFHNHEETVLKHTWSPESKRVYMGENIKEGLKAFTEKRAPEWKNPAKL